MSDETKPRRCPGGMDDTCNHEPADALHPCPYKDELYNDNITLCWCCTGCVGDCHDEV
jgi:hypothetical protein